MCLPPPGPTRFLFGALKKAAILLALKHAITHHGSRVPVDAAKAREFHVQLCGQLSYDECFSREARKLWRKKWKAQRAEMRSQWKCEWRDQWREQWRQRCHSSSGVGGFGSRNGGQFDNFGPMLKAHLASKFGVWNSVRSQFRPMARAFSTSRFMGYRHCPVSRRMDRMRRLRMRLGFWQPNFAVATGLARRENNAASWNLIRGLVTRASAAASWRMSLDACHHESLSQRPIGLSVARKFAFSGRPGAINLSRFGTPRSGSSSIHSSGFGQVLSPVIAPVTARGYHSTATGTPSDHLDGAQLWAKLKEFAPSSAIEFAPEPVQDAAFVEFDLTPHLSVPSAGELNEEVLEVLERDFEAHVRELRAILRDIRQTGTFGELPVTVERANGALRIHFPNADVEKVQRLLADAGVTRGVVYDATMPHNPLTLSSSQHSQSALEYNSDVWGFNSTSDSYAHVSGISPNLISTGSAQTPDTPDTPDTPSHSRGSHFHEPLNSPNRPMSPESSSWPGFSGDSSALSPDYVMVSPSTESTDYDMSTPSLTNSESGSESLSRFSAASDALRALVR
uniref:ARAD1D23606p n=1 Tax=Blastobotrys adeninivorans TaxID=409370 RepID=A0A060TAF8_BLAAD